MLDLHSGGYYVSRGGDITTFSNSGHQVDIRNHYSYYPGFSRKRGLSCRNPDLDFRLGEQTVPEEIQKRVNIVNKVVPVGSPAAEDSKTSRD